MDFFQKMYGIALQYAQKFAGKAGQLSKKAMPSELIYVVELDASKSDYEIDLGTQNGNTNIPIENRLAFKDNFVVSGMAVGVLSQKLISSVPQWGTSHPVFWEDPNVFNGAVGSFTLTESEAVAGVWAGHITFQGNEELKIVRMPLRGFRTIQQTQRATTYSTDGTLTGSDVTFNMQDGTEYKSLGGIMKIAGGNENRLQVHIECKDKGNLVGHTNAKNYLYIALRGAFIKGGTLAELQG